MGKVLERKEVKRGIDEAHRDEKESLLSLNEIAKIHHDSLKLAGKLQKLLVVKSRRKKARISRKKTGRKRKVYK